MFTNDDFKILKQFIKDISYHPNDIINLKKRKLTTCDYCPNNIQNGGSGICHCILGTPKIT